MRLLARLASRMFLNWIWAMNYIDEIWLKSRPRTRSWGARSLVRGRIAEDVNRLLLRVSRIKWGKLQV
jgi:hypothetical protein